jgi:S-adenosylmethionine-diacylgycerolhomoserine-N-methlytransferase
MSDAHAFHMDRMYAWQRHIYDLTRKPYLLGRDHLIRQLAPPAGGSVLEIGCGTGRNMARVGALYPDCALYGVDISTVMLEEARKTFVRTGLSRRACIARADAAHFDPALLFNLAHFDRIFFSYSLSMIPQWREALALALSLLASNGSLHVVDFGAQEGLPAAAKKLLRAWLAHFSVAPRDEAAAALRDMADAHAMRMSVMSLRRGYATYFSVKRGA